MFRGLVGHRAGACRCQQQVSLHHNQIQEAAFVTKDILLMQCMALLATMLGRLPAAGRLAGQ